MDEEGNDPVKFLIVGLIASTSFQKCRFYADKLAKYFPAKYQPPEVRAMLNLDWELYLTKMKRRHGKEFWVLKKPVVVYINGEFLGDDSAFALYISKKFSFEVDADFDDICNQELIKYFTNAIENDKRKFIYLTISVDQRVIGSMLFLLYCDLVPLTCENFLRRCNDSPNGYCGTKIHRLAKTSWIQCGDGCNLQHRKMPCENYVIGHDKRGVLSMCNSKRHRKNSTQFFVTLDPTSWMDYKYVAFGQLVQGAEVLTQIETIPTYYQAPLTRIEIVDCGEFTLCPKSDDAELLLKDLGMGSTASLTDWNRFHDDASVMSVRKYLAGKYCLPTDLRNYLPLVSSYIMNIIDLSGLEGEDESNDQTHKLPKINPFSY